MWPERDPVRPADVGAAAALALPAALVLATVLAAWPPSSDNAAAADPLIQLLGGPWPVVPAALVVLGAWASRVRPSPADLARAARWAALGGGAAVLGALVVFAIFGDALPSFVPPEESARAGLGNGVAAGLVEEVVSRFAVLPLAYAALRQRLGVTPSIALAAILTGLAFSLSHELGPAGDSFELRYLITRFVFPGVVMSAIFLRAHPAFMVTAHVVAHFVIPALFR